MNGAMMIAANGVQNQQRRVDTIADNIANVNTVGFKSTRLDFKEALYTAGLAGPARTPGGNLQKGHGVMAAAVSREFGDGSISATGGKLDFAIEGDGFFEVRDAEGNRLYTRAGNFYLSSEAGGAYLVTSNGHYVQNDRGERISVPQGTTSVTVTQEGEMTFEAGAVRRRDRLGLYTFDNRNGLVSRGMACYEDSAATGGARPAAGAAVRQGALESSNVDLGTELTRLMRAQRAFSLASRALATADDMEGIANNLRR